MNPTKPPCLLRLTAYPAEYDGGFVATTFEMGGPALPEAVLTIKRADEIPVAIERFSAAIALLWPSASFTVHPAHLPRQPGQPGAQPGRKVAGFDAAIDSCRRLQHTHVRDNQAPEGERLTDDPLPPPDVLACSAREAVEKYDVQVLACAIHAEVTARRQRQRRAA